jgi:predicted AAA+ superfamily ATPase
MISIARTLEHSLAAWFKNPNRKVLLLRGARQVGKTYLVRKHAAHYKHVLEVNFLSDKRTHDFFGGNIDVATILENLSTLYGVPIEDGETLLFFDEIQECPEAITALRFFYEKRPGLHIIATGSLLEFALSGIPSFGVGRIESIFLHTLTFDEYLGACGEEKLLSYLQSVGPGSRSNSPIHEKLLSLLKVFLFHGGLPEAVTTFLETRNYQRTNLLIDSIRLSFEDDFAKYRGRIPVDRLREVFRSAALQAGKKFVHSHAYPDANSGQVHHAMGLLNQAGIVHKIYHSSANGVPLGGEIDSKKFKAIPFDHGIYQRVIGVTPSEVIVKDFDPINKGAMAEVFAGNALIALGPPHSRENLHYWHRESKSSNAEVDYVVQVNDKIVPIEIKSGRKGKMQSIQRFIEEKESSNGPGIGIRSSFENFAKVGNILVIPLYALSQIERLVAEG